MALADPIFRTDFDHLSPDHADRWIEQTDAIRRHGPVGWTEAHGGFWVLVGYDEVRQVAIDYRNFSSLHDITGADSIARGIGIPPFDYPLILTESDPPVSIGRRRIEEPFFRPQDIRALEAKVRVHVDEAMEPIRRRGHGDLFLDLAMPVSAKTAFALVGIDVARWEDFTVARDGTQPSPAVMAAESERVRGLLHELVTDRRRNPQGDIVTALTKGQVQGQGLTDDEAVSMLSALVLGGFDTTSSLVTSGFIWLDRNREDHDRLRADPALLTNAVDEFMRVFPPTIGGARNIVADVEMGGVRMRRGERVLMSWQGVNRDPKVFPDPHRVRIDRENAIQNFGFGVGPHRCLGSQLARMVARLCIAAVLEQTPGFRVDHQRTVRSTAGRFVTAWASVPVTV